MGLDVYLYKFETPPNRGEDDDYEGGEQVEIDSKVHPDHMFKIGYLRSSYNDGGINHLLRNYLGGRDLAWIFGNEANEYEFQPDWAASLKRCRQLRQELADHRKKAGGVTVTEFTYNPFLGVPKVSSKAAALETYLTVAEKHKAPADDMSWFSNRDGDYFLGSKPMRVRAVFPGVREGYMGKLTGGPTQEPCFYVVHEQTDDNDWYGRALEITAEMIEWVLGQPEPQKFWLHWSG